MELKRDVKPITYLKNHTADLVRDVADEGRTVMITQNGEAKVVIMDVETYDRWQSAMTLLKDAGAGRGRCGRRENSDTAAGMDKSGASDPLSRA